MPKNLDAQVDRLYQLPLDEFTAARNALAKEAGKDGAAIKQLVKPPVAAWAVNQLYGNRRNDYDRLIDAAEAMRKAHKAVIEGKRGDLRSAGREHELAVETALKSTVELLKEREQPVTDATRHAILNILRALPSDEPPGRLSRALTPGGFEMLAGVTPRKAAGARPTPAPVSRPGPADSKAAKEAARQRTEREAAERAVRDAEHHARRAEFEAARAVRDATKAEKRFEEARRALEAAQEEAEAAQKAAAAATRARESAERKSRDAESTLAAARSKLR
jgi:hypothetical protein